MADATQPSTPTSVASSEVHDDVAAIRDVLSVQHIPVVGTLQWDKLQFLLHSLVDRIANQASPLSLSCLPFFCRAWRRKAKMKIYYGKGEKKNRKGRAHWPQLALCPAWTQSCFLVLAPRVLFFFFEDTVSTIRSLDLQIRVQKPVHSQLLSLRRVSLSTAVELEPHCGHYRSSPALSALTEG